MHSRPMVNTWGHDCHLVDTMNTAISNQNQQQANIFRNHFPNCLALWYKESFQVVVPRSMLHVSPSASEKVGLKCETSTQGVLPNSLLSLPDAKKSARMESGKDFRCGTKDHCLKGLLMSFLYWQNTLMTRHSGNKSHTLLQTYWKDTKFQ